MVRLLAKSRKLVRPKAERIRIKCIIRTRLESIGTGRLTFGQLYPPKFKAVNRFSATDEDGEGVE